MSSGTEYYVAPRVPGVRPLDPPDYDGIVFVYIFTYVKTAWIQPAVNQTAQIQVENAQGFVPGMTIVIENGGYYQVESTDALNRMVVMNYGTAYNQPPGSSIAPGKVTTTSLPGPPGGVGPAGPTGPTGSQGPVGPPLNAKGSVANAAALPASGSIGDFWTTLNDGHGHVWEGSWIDIGPFLGPAGATGATGATGPQGPPGATGPTGAQGATGATGAQGPQGPQGNPGATGATGPQGPQGATGATGPQGPPGGASANTTLSATFTMPAVNSTGVASVVNAGAFSVGGVIYITNLGYLAVTNVNTGANQLTLQNLGYAANGAPGATAPSGTALTGVGPQGPQGPAGATGATGPAGATGPQGPIGNTGAQGPTGATGATGATGPQGIAGTKWWNGTGAPTPPPTGSVPGDYYLDTASGDVYVL